MGPPEKLGVRKKRLLLIVVTIFVLAAFLRFYHIDWSFSNNGVDEGIMLERSLLVSDGYRLYSELPCDQAPLAFYVGAMLQGDVLALRVLVAALSLVAVAACMLAANRVGGEVAMLTTGLLLAFDFAFLRESRLFSLDGLSTCFLAFSMPLFVAYVQKHNRLALAGSGFLVGLSASTKLLGALAVVGMMIYIVLEARRAKGSARTAVTDLAVVLVTSAVPPMALMALLGPSDVLQGMVLNQGHRAFEPFLKLSVLAYLGLNAAYLLPLVYARIVWGSSKEARYLLCLSAVLLAFMVLQPLTLFHHMVLLSPGLAILAGVFVSKTVELKKSYENLTLGVLMPKKYSAFRKGSAAVLAIGIVVSYGLALYGIAAQGEPAQKMYAEILADITEPRDWVISGDPLIAAYAERMVPPEVANVGYRQYPDLTLDEIEKAISDYDVKAVVVCYRLNDIEGLHEYLIATGFEESHQEKLADDRAVLDLFEKGLGTVTFYAR